MCLFEATRIVSNRRRRTHRKGRIPHSILGFHRSVEHRAESGNTVSMNASILGEGEGEGEGTHFLFVLIWPTWPQFAHFRWVPTGRPEPGPPSAGDSPVEPRTLPFCFSRAKRRSLFRLRRESSFSILERGVSRLERGGMEGRRDAQFSVAVVDFFVSCWSERFESDHC